MGRKPAHHDRVALRDYVTETSARRTLAPAVGGLSPLGCCKGVFAEVGVHACTVRIGCRVEVVAWC